MITLGGSDSTALVTMPDDQEGGQNGSLTSPNLVHSMNPGMSLASATSFAKMQSSSKSSVRKESSSSVSTMKSTAGQAQAVVSCSAQESASSASSHSASIGG